MSSPTWTASALASESRPFAGDAWRMVEAQHVASSSKLLADPDEQAELERLLDASKPTLPEAARGLHYLLTTPWRYRPGPGGSRFRGQFDPGVWYGAETVACAAAEIGYWRCRFIRDSDGLQRLDPLPYTAFRASMATTAIDIRQSPLDRDLSRWADPDSYRDSQALALLARDADLGAIVYPSARHPARPPPWCVAVLKLEAFARPRPRPDFQTWFLTATGTDAVWNRAMAGMRLAFHWPR